jgi:FixJ family two-component response regulator
VNVPASIVYLVDDDASVRRAFARLLRSAGHQVEAFGSAQEFLKGDRRDAGPACVVLDLQMPGLSGLDLQRELLARGIGLPIVFITGHGDILSSVRAMKAGAVDFLLKPVSGHDVLGAVEQALARDARERVRRGELDDLRARAATLTPREQEVMELVAQGLLNKQIAARLGTGEKTVKVHRGRVMHKMQVESLPDLVRAVERLGNLP